MNEEYAYDESDVGLEAEDKAEVGSTRQEWLKMTKGQALIGSFLYFHTVDANAVKALRAVAKRDKRQVTPEEIKAAATKALTDRAAAMDPARTPDKLEPWERLDLSVAQFKRFKAHYQQGGVNYVISRLGLDGPEADLVWKRLPEQKQYFSTLLLAYPMNREGKHDIQAIKDGNIGRLVPWRFGPGIYDEIWNLNDGLRGNGMSIATQDLKLVCTEGTYQNMNVSIIGKAVWQSSPKFKKLVLTQALDLYSKLVPFREMTTDQLRAKLGLGGSPVGDVSGEDFTGLLDNV